MVLIIFFIIFVSIQPGRISGDEEDAYLTIVQISSKNGYPNETHHVTTSDGYILALQRIPHGRNNTISDKPVLVLHGIFLSSAGFLSTGIDHALGYLLADEGYDVWLGNVRGVEYSRNHTTLDPDKDEEFWNFSWNEMGMFDLPAMIDYVLNATGRSSLYYVGHSQGSTVFYVMTTTRPEYNAKVKVHMAMAPAVYLNNTKSVPIRSAAHRNDFLNWLIGILKIDEIPTEWMLSIKGVICRLSPSFCNYVFMAAFSYKPSDVNLTVTTRFSGNFPTAASGRQVFHFLQIIKSGYFRRYDFGKENMKVYGSSTPPSYNLTLVTTKCHLFYSRDDQAVSETDVTKLCEELGDACVKKYLITNGTVKHLDWVMGKNIRELVYSKLVTIMGGY